MSNEDVTSSDSGWESLPEHLKDDKFLLVMKELSIVAGHNRPLVLVTHAFIEMATEALIGKHCKNAKKVLNDSRSYPHSTKLLVLNELGVLSDDTYRVFDWFRKLRNRAAHDALFELKKEDFANIKIQRLDDPLSHFHRFCILLLAGFWNEHSEVFGPIFSPGAIGLESE